LGLLVLDLDGVCVTCFAACLAELEVVWVGLVGDRQDGTLEELARLVAGEGARLAGGFE
jgi:hypothetical protein